MMGAEARMRTRMKLGLLIGDDFLLGVRRRGYFHSISVASDDDGFAFSNAHENTDIISPRKLRIPHRKESTIMVANSSLNMEQKREMFSIKYHRYTTSS